MKDIRTQILSDSETAQRRLRNVLTIIFVVIGLIIEYKIVVYLISLGIM